MVLKYTDYPLNKTIYFFRVRRHQLIEVFRFFQYAQSKLNSNYGYQSPQNQEYCTKNNLVIFLKIWKHEIEITLKCFWRSLQTCFYCFLHFSYKHSYSFFYWKINKSTINFWQLFTTLIPWSCLKWKDFTEICHWRNFWLFLSLLCVDFAFNWYFIGGKSKTVLFEYFFFIILDSSYYIKMVHR